ncbi:UNVERIFIED_CONTAM: protein CutA, chloroplastic [Sesamum angustifolium]|uniref:Protein CutA, chloroplastic n=1 Tax=Sesamum angustifolium TaxID=2727405 RepID=A0AAW2N661_9LAMI
MALRLSSVVSSTVVRRRIPLVGAFCVLSLGLSNLCSISLTSRTGFVQSLPFVPLLSSKFGAHAQTQNRKVHNISMEASKNTVPSIVVYVTVPNKEAGKKLAESIVKARLAACVNRVPGVESVYEWKGEVNILSSPFNYSCWWGRWRVGSVILQKGHVMALVSLYKLILKKLLIIKTRESLLEPLTEHVKANHEYE